ncbi:alpha/beta hydrolase [Parendozoicomonas haliclonae]|uniref:alpha/beta hydrolase n=1 Tax=Parendozoicomonas haliclonae TaxID=1960125 RepID=UPI0010567085|nr:hypothetical protein [Parendozoicomonas haliclonae]
MTLRSELQSENKVRLFLLRVVLITPLLFVVSDLNAKTSAYKLPQPKASTGKLRVNPRPDKTNADVALPASYTPNLNIHNDPDTRHNVNIWNQVPDSLIRSGQFYASPPSLSKQAMSLAISDLLIPGSLLVSSHFLLGFLNRQMMQTIPSESLRGMSYPLLAYIWQEQMIPSESWMEKIINLFPPLLDGAMILASRTQYWAGLWTHTIRELLALYTTAYMLSKPLLREYELWQTQHQRQITLDNAPELENTLNILLERYCPVEEPARNRLTLTFQQRCPQQPIIEEGNNAPFTKALKALYHKACELGTSALQLYPADYNGQARLFVRWKTGDFWTYPQPVELPEIHNKWWTTLVSEHYFESSFQNSEQIKRLADPLSIEVLNRIAGRTSQPAPSLDAFLVQHQHGQQLGILSGTGHANIWLTQPDSALFSTNDNRLPLITLQSAPPFQGETKQLQQHLKQPLLPGWAQLPWQVTRVALFTKLRLWAWQKGLRAGDNLEAWFTFPGAYMDWDTLQPPGHARRIRVRLSDGKYMTGNLVCSTRGDGRSLIVVYHPTKDTSDRLANAGLLTLDEQGQATVLGKYLNDRGYDVFFPEYRGYRNDLKPVNRKQFLNDAVRFFDHISADYDRISVIGYSIGTGAASHVAHVRGEAIERLILLAPFQELRDVGRQLIGIVPPNWCLRFNMNNRAELMKTEIPVHIFHGSRDRLIPARSSQHMFDYLRENSTNKALNYHLIEGQGHNKILTDPSLMSRIMDIFSAQR